MTEENTFTTDFIPVTDGESISITPQELVEQNALIDIVSAEAQFKGDEDVSFNTVSDNDTNSDSARANTFTVTRSNTNRDDKQTSGLTNVSSDPKSASQSKTALAGNTTGRMFLTFPGEPNNYDSDDVTINSVSVDYFVEDPPLALTEKNVTVEFDDDPFDSRNFDSSKEGFTVPGGSKVRVGGFTYNLNSSQGNGTDFYNNNLDGGNLKIVEGGDSRAGGTVRGIIETSVDFEVQTRETDPFRKTVSVSYPDTPFGYSFRKHEITIKENGVTKRTITQTPFRENDGAFSEKTGPNIGDTKEIIIETIGADRRTNNGTASVNYPNIPTGQGFSLDRYEIEETRNGNTVTSRTVRKDDVSGNNRDGQSESITSFSQSRPVNIEITAYYSKVVRNVDNTSNPTIEGDFLPERLDTSSVIFAIDKSESVNLQKEKFIARQIINNLSEETLASIIEFQYDANTVVEKKRVGDSNVRSELITGVNNINKSGGTELIPALNTASDKITEDSNDDSGTIVVISDGQIGDKPVDRAGEIADDGIQISSILVDSSETDVLSEIADISNGVFFDGTVNIDLFGTVLTNNERSEFVSIKNITRDEQTLTFSIEESGKAEFRLRFTWEYLTPEPRVGVVGFYNDFLDVWKEAAVANPEDVSLNFNHVQVYNDNIDEWGALDVVELSNENAITEYQFYDEDAGWLAPREFNRI